MEATGYSLGLLALLAHGCGRIGYEPSAETDLDGRIDPLADSPSLVDVASADGTSPDGTMPDARPDAIGGAGPPNDTCAGAEMLVRAGGPVMATTCGADDSVQTSCAPAGTPDVFYYVTVPPSGTVDINVPDGFYVTAAQDEGPCPFAPSTICAVSLGEVNMTTAEVTVILVVEQAAGGCGSFTIRAM